MSVVSLQSIITYYMYVNEVLLCSRAQALCFAVEHVLQEC